MPISPGPATNSGTTANVFEAARATDSEEAGKITSTVKGKNAGTAAALFEARAAEAGQLPGQH